MRDVASRATAGPWPAVADFWRPCLSGLNGSFDGASLGVTMVIDKGVPVAHLGDVLEVAAPFVQLWKLGFGTAALYRPEQVARKVRAARAFGVEVYAGGTFLELARVGGSVEMLLERLEELGLRWVEVSDGTYPMSAAARRDLIRHCLGRGFQVVTEVGSKDPSLTFDPARAAQQVVDDLALGARYAIVEARDSGRGVGVFDEAGRLRGRLFDELLARLQAARQHVIWEAPRPEQQRELLLRLGPGVGLGNVQVGDIVTLGAMRLGLRSDTMRVWVVPGGPVDGPPEGG